MRKLLEALEGFPGAEDEDDFCYRMGQTCTGVCPECRPDLRQGVLVIPEEVSFTDDGGAFEGELLEALTKPITDDGTTSTSLECFRGLRPDLVILDETATWAPPKEVSVFEEQTVPEIVEQMLADALPFIRSGGRVRLTVVDKDTDRRGQWEVEKP
jgi:hypothetical protein